MTMTYRIVFTPEARDQLDHLHAYYLYNGLAYSH
jgi:hypothetical protein